ncbi:MAG: hypothetical protein ABIO43_03720 [Sphingomicrobium sp.]
MALIERHPDVEDYFSEMTLDEIEARGGVADLIEDGRLVLIKDFRLDFDFEVLERIEKSLEGVSDPALRHKLKKLEAPHFLEGEPPIERNGTLRFPTPVQQALFDVICHGDKALFERTRDALRYSHERAISIFGLAFPSYEPFRLVASLRLTRTLFENLHWDDHSIDDDFHQARVFANLDTRPRIWHVSHRIPEMMRLLYMDHDLGRFAGQDPNKMLYYINGEVLGGLQQKWRDTGVPRHRVAFDPGEVWLGESRLISHQIYYGESALVYMWFMKAKFMADSDKRFNIRVEQIHEEMRQLHHA